MATETRDSRPKIVIERTYRATPRELWDLWATKDGFESWWGPEGFRAEVHEIAARVGGALRYDMIADAPDMVAAMRAAGQPVSHPVAARFTEVAPFTRLAITSVIDFLPGVETYESTILVELVELGASVRMIVTLDPMHNEQFSQMQAQGMTSQIGKLDRRYA